MGDYGKLLDNIYEKLNVNKAGSGERFEVPAFDVLNEGKNKTIVKNFKRICDAIRRDPVMLARYLSREVGAPVDIDGERMIIHRRVMGPVLQKRIDFFVKEYVICQQCGKPDTNLVTIERTKMLVCESCGARRPVK
jgi:translation initiation factor 2 subunit 2